MKPAVRGIPASDSIITVITPVSTGRRQNRPRYSNSASASRPLYGVDIRVTTPKAPREVST
ncbi:hypothetical protein D9M71_617420 [compost metagenome]